jgi:hypothetical protein
MMVITWHNESRLVIDLCLKEKHTSITYMMYRKIHATLDVIIGGKGNSDKDTLIY